MLFKAKSIRLPKKMLKEYKNYQLSLDNSVKLALKTAT